ncbi:MAG TPA: hypothetical protein V6D08_02325 [Candidatus Obscuribacterales bacterium]
MQNLEFANEPAISSNLSATMRTPWGRLDSSKPLTLSRVWSDGQQMYLSLVHSNQGIEQDYLLGLIVPDGSYVLIQAPGSWWDPDLMDPPQTLLRVAEGHTLTALEDSEFAAALDKLRAAVASRHDQTAADSWQELRSTAKELFGSLFQEAPAQHLSGDWPFEEIEDDTSSDELGDLSSVERDAQKVWQEETEWIGMLLDGYCLDELLCDGPYSWVLRGIRTDDGSVLAFKIAKPLELSGRVKTPKGAQTTGIVFTTGSITGVHPDPQQLLAAQAHKLQALADPAFVSVESFDLRNSECYLKMGYLHGQTLKELAQRQPVPISVFVKLLEALDRLSQNPKFDYHGDIKPENIMVDSEGGIKLLDPGHFGPLDCQEGNYGYCIVTTPAYYPLLTPDDMFAVGIMLWEIACKRHPLDGSSSLDEIPLNGLAEDLIQWVRAAQVVGQHFLMPLLQAGRPSHIRPDLSPAAEQTLLKAMRLRLTPDNKIGRDPGFASFSEFADALRGVIALGLKEL